MKFYIIIPARMASSRFPGKPLADVLGLPMVVRVARQASKAKGVSGVYVATDHVSIAETCELHGIQALLTSAEHPSGTDRIFEAASILQHIHESDVIINVQGDEPFIDPTQIEQLAHLFTNSEVNLATLVRKSNQTDEVINPSVVKAVVGANGKALYFSRSVIPYYRNENDSKTFFTHVGMYAYRYETLTQIAALQPSALELAEHLEQLRWLENGFSIYTAETLLETYAVDTPSDLDFIRKKFSS